MRGEREGYKVQQSSSARIKSVMLRLHLTPYLTQRTPERSLIAGIHLWYETIPRCLIFPNPQGDSPENCYRFFHRVNYSVGAQWKLP